MFSALMDVCFHHYNGLKKKKFGDFLKVDGCNDLQVEVVSEVRNVAGFCCCYLVAKSGLTL